MLEGRVWESRFWFGTGFGFDLEFETEAEVAAEDEAGIEKKKGGEEEVNFRASEDEGDDAVADGAEDGPGFDRKIKFGCRSGTDGDALLWVLNRRGLEIDEIITVGDGQRKG